ncbi:MULTISPECIES: hemolysin family protein [Sulfitobacter]|uniref:hemolysin family protein n=1 Tax=Sulfitobacter TaxID=60136 RepID=UPI002307188A|nr:MULTISPECIES: hemolysin family protein [Sulfitobacter]MDF3383485.1 HlyC/CorC family transporter [Sulfitobacter sp. Ks11]MDF3386903.1 HlyC/CorC family transporter [Sulfitobacter sp. M85]MDF3390323.1 HlyC/CorC family transporter [Sulfitobacter sp. Ks16]MDF3400960.1 HlyC/CorC family transporter [Sulfitobacter sp. KE39]MDF3404381.1 HlyC/CorC family transporter [Sulfitobacter sp. Ks35]
MGDTDGSSDAAQSALTDEDRHEQPDDGAMRTGNFFSRVFEALSPSDSEEDTPETSAEAERPTGHGMMNLRRMRVDDVAIPKADITAVPVSATLDELVSVFKESGMTRLPVYDGTLDTPVGMVHLKDLALNHGFNGKNTKFDLRTLLRPLVYVPPSMTIGVLLTKMQAERRHMALVIDEYGGVDGLVTIEDLIEQVIGEIEDEHDVDEGTYWTVEKPGTYLALAKTPLGDFEAEIGHSLTDHETVDEEEIDTLGGLVFMLSGRVPARGEVVLHPDGPEFEVIDADPRRIKRLRVRTQGAGG